jgi:hypothetical protein
MTREKKIIEFIKNWLNTNMDEPTEDTVQEDSANLKEYIEHFEQGSINIDQYL